MSNQIQELLNYILPKVQDGKQEEAKQVIAENTSGAAAEKGGLGGLLGNIGSKLGVDLGNVNLTSMLPQLLSLIKPEYVQDVQKFVTGFFNKNTTEK